MQVYLFLDTHHYWNSLSGPYWPHHTSDTFYDNWMDDSPADSVHLQHQPHLRPFSLLHSILPQGCQVYPGILHLVGHWLVWPDLPFGSGVLEDRYRCVSLSSKKLTKPDAG